jgi:peptidyl-prolyl cis-trans isomerase D|tara:strand:+ start:563 stop:2422 length:1860 start_codon:yes stop_codon:yes gene_type:complete
MLTRIREKLSTWVIALLLLFIAIPLVFMGLGNYQSATDTYAFKINDQVITTSQLEQEVFQYRQALEKNTQGSLPPFYTNKFLRSITMDYMLRTIILDNTAKDYGLVFHNSSLLNKIYNTSSFRDESGFNRDIYKSQLYRIGMTPQSYEGYIYQKGISEQLKNAITSTSIVTAQEKVDLIKFRHQTRIVNYKILEFETIKDSIKINNSVIEDYYNKNKSSYMSDAFAKYQYIDIDKNDIIKNINVTEEIITDIYNANLVDGNYNKPSKYEINHLLVTGKSIESEKKIKGAYEDLKSGVSFDKVTATYSNDEETLTNKGYLGEFIASDLPTYLSSELSNLDINEVSEIIESDKGFHLISIRNKTSNKPSSLEDKRSTIVSDYKKEMGTRKYFDLIDDIEERNFTKNYNISDISTAFNLPLLSSKFISKSDGHGIFNFDFVRNKIFVNDVIKNNETSDLIYINDDRFIIVQLLTYKEPVQLSYQESKDIIKTLLLTQKTNELIKIKSEEQRDNLNAGLSNLDTSFKTFVGTMDSNDISNDLKEIFFSKTAETGFLTTKINNNYLIYNIDAVTYPNDIEKIKNSDDYYNFVLNTRSESEFNLFYNNISSKLDIIINNDYMDRD